jgi:hypothetical protein
VIRERILGVFKLQTAVYDAISRDPGAGIQAALVVALVAVFLALGNRISPIFGDLGVAANFSIAMAWTFFSWILWTGILAISARLISDQRVSFNQLLRVIGFAYAPQTLAILPWFGALLGAFWSLAAIFVAVRQVLAVNNRKATLTLIIGLTLYSVLIAAAIEFIRQISSL